MEGQYVAFFVANPKITTREYLGWCKWFIEVGNQTECKTEVVYPVMSTNEEFPFFVNNLN